MSLDDARFYRAYATRSAKAWSIIGSLSAFVFFTLGLVGSNLNIDFLPIIVGALGVFTVFCMFVIFIFTIKSFVIAPNALCVFSLISSIGVGLFSFIFSMGSFGAFGGLNMGGYAWLFYVMVVFLFLFSFLSFTLGSYRREYKSYLREAKRSGLSSAQIHNYLAMLKNGSITKAGLFSALSSSSSSSGSSRASSSRSASASRASSSSSSAPRSSSSSSSSASRFSSSEEMEFGRRREATSEPTLPDDILSTGSTRRSSSSESAFEKTAARAGTSSIPKRTATAPKRTVSPVTDRGYPNMEAYFDCKDTSGNPIKLREGEDGLYYDIQNLPYVKVGDAFQVKDE